MFETPPPSTPRGLRTPRTPREAAIQQAVEQAASQTHARFSSDFTAQANRDHVRARRADALEEENRKLRLRISELEKTVSKQDEELIALRAMSAQLAAQIKINHRLQEQITNSANENTTLRTNYTQTLSDLAAERRTIADLRQQIAGRLTRAEGANLTASNQRLSETLRQAELRASKLEQTSLDQETTILQQKERISFLENQLETSQLTTEEALREKNQALKDLAEEKGKSRALQTTIDSQNLLLSAAENNVKRLEKQLATLRSSTVDAETMRLKERELQEAKREIIALKEQIEDLKSQLAAQQSIIDGLRSQVGALTLENTQLKGELATAATTITHLTDERDALTLANDTLQKNLQASQDAKRALQEKVDGLTTAAATLTDQKNAADAKVTSVQSQLTKALSKTAQDTGEIQRLKDLLKVSTDNADTLATNLADKTRALDEANQTIVRLNAEILDLKGQIEGLKEQLAEKTTALSDAQATITRLTGELTTAQEERSTALSERDEARSDLQTRTDELATVTEQVAGLKTEVSTLTTEKNAADAEVTRLTNALGDAHKTSAALEAAKLKVSNLESKLGEKSSQLRSANGRISALNREVDQLKIIIQEKDAKISELEGKIAELTAENAELRQKLQEQDSEITKLEVSLAEARTEATEAKSAQKIAEDTLVTTGEALAKATTKIGTLEADIVALNRNARENEAAILAKQTELDGAKQTERELRSNLDIAEANAIREKDRADKLARGVEKLQEKLKSVLAENARLKEDIQKLAADAVELQNTVDQITIQNAEVNTKLQEALLGSQQLTNDLGVATASIVSLRQKLEAEGTEKAATQLLLNEAIANKKRLESALDDQKLRVKSLESQVGTLSRQLSSKTRECGKLRDLVIEHKRMLAEQTRKRELAEAELAKSQELLRSTTVTKDALALQLGATEEKLVMANAEMASMEQKHLAATQALDTTIEDYQTQLDELKAKHDQSIHRIKSRLVTVIEEKKEILAKLVVAQQTIADLKQESQALKTELADTREALASTKTELANKALEVEESTRLLKESEEKRIEAENARKLAEKATEIAELEARRIEAENNALQQVVIEAKAVVSEKDAQLEAVKLQLVDVSGKSEVEIARLRDAQSRIQRELEESRRREEESQKRLQDFERQARILRAYKIMAGIQTKRMSADTISHKSEKAESEATLITYRYDTHVANRERFSESIERAQNNQESIRYLLKIRKSNPELYLKLKRNFDIKNHLLMSIGGTELERYHHEITHEARDNMQNKLKR